MTKVAIMIIKEDVDIYHIHENMGRTIIAEERVKRTKEGIQSKFDETAIKEVR